MHRSMKLGRDTAMARSPGFVGRREGRVVGDGRIAAHAVVVLHPPLGGESVVVPAHRVEDLSAPHAVVPGHGVGVGVGEAVSGVQRPRHRRRGRVYGVDVGARSRSGRSGTCRPRPSGQPHLASRPSIDGRSGTDGRRGASRLRPRGARPAHRCVLPHVVPASSTVALPYRSAAPFRYGHRIGHAAAAP